MYAKELISIHENILNQLSTLSFDSIQVCNNFILTKERFLEEVNFIMSGRKW